MSEQQQAPKGPDLAKGVRTADIVDGAMLLGHVKGEPVLVARTGNNFSAIGAVCTHYGGPLAEGLIVGDTVRCPWHHACFSLRTGTALRAPALNPVSCWRIDQRTETLYVREKIEPVPRRPTLIASATPSSIVIIGGGAAGNAAAEVLRNEGYAGPVTILSADDAVPCDRPNLSKDYLAGTAPEEWIPLRSPEFYRDNQIELRLKTRVASIDRHDKRVALENGSTLRYGALLLATGAQPVRLTVPGADQPHVLYLRGLGDCRTLIAKTRTARNAVIVGASFIGLEVAASLRTRGIAVHVVAPEAYPMQRILGDDVGKFVRALHERHGVVFHLGKTLRSIAPRCVTLSDGTAIDADLVVVGIGVRPVISLAEKAGLSIDRGILVDEHLETNANEIFAAGDIARWPDRLTGERIRVEHWVVAERQGQTAARNMLGLKERFSAVPFFWSQHYDMTISYVGHAEHWDSIAIDGAVEKDCSITYSHRGRKLAVATISRDRESLKTELEFERQIAS